MKIRLLSLFLFISLSIFSQKKEVLYEVDGIKVDQKFYEELSELNEENVDHFKEVKEIAKLNELGYSNAKSLIQIYTKKYVERADSLKRIPSTKTMNRIQGEWHLNDSPRVYTGPFRDYYLNGNLQGKGTFVDGKLNGKRWLYYKDGSVSEELNYKDGFPEGEEIRYFQDGTIKQKGYYSNGYEVGEWKKYHPNGNLKQVSHFSENGKLNGEVKTYYSTGEIKGSSEFVNGVLQENRKTKKLQEVYETGEQRFQLSDFEEAIELFSKCISLKPTWNDAYFARGTAYLNHNEFDKAIADFNKAIEIEPLDAYSYTNRAFVLIRKKEFENAKEISSTEGLQVFGNLKVELSNEDLALVCQDLQKAKSLGDESRMLLDALKKYCLPED